MELSAFNRPYFDLQTMLAYTTVTDIFQLPTAIEATVYLGGLVFILICPYLFLWAIDKASTATKSAQKAVDANQAEAQRQ